MNGLKKGETSLLSRKHGQFKMRRARGWVCRSAALYYTGHSSLFALPVLFDTLLESVAMKSSADSLVRLLSNPRAYTGTDDNETPRVGELLSATGLINQHADEPDPDDHLAAEFTAFRQPIKHIAIIGSRNIPLPHQNLIEALAFMLVKEGNTLITSGGTSGTNAAVIRGASRADATKLKVVLPQKIEQQPSDVQNMLIGLPTIVEHPEWAMMPLADASRLCNREIIDDCQQLIMFLFHDSGTLKQAVDYAEEQHKMVTNFFLD